MIPLVLLPLVTEILRLVNNIIDGIPIEQRKANSILWFNTTWPLIKGLFPVDVQTQIETAMKSIV